MNKLKQIILKWREAFNRHNDKEVTSLAGESEHNRSVMTEDGKRIAFIHVKKGFSKVIIIAHGFYNNKDTVLFRGITDAFSKEYDVIVFDFRGHGKSSDVFTWTAHEQKDLRAIIAYAKENHYVENWCDRFFARSGNCID